MNTQSLTVKKLTQKDFPAVYKFWQFATPFSYPSTVEREKYLLLLKHNKNLAWALEHKTEIIGTVIGGFDGRTAIIYRLAVHPQFRKKGLGKRLMQKLHTEFVKQNINRISAHVHESNKEVVGFYKTLGYEIDQLIVMKKNITPVGKVRRRGD